MYDPYKILGITSDASQEEIKRAYRRKAKECHPDLHPDDPNASKKMNEVNEAYEYLTNPEKKAQRDARDAQENQRQPSSSGYYGNYSGGYRQNTGNSSNQSYGNSQGPGGWSSAYGFNFDDIFGFAFGGGANQDTTPRPQSGDHPALVRAINALTRGQWIEAEEILVSMPGSLRNGRWYYVASYVKAKTGDFDRAQEYILRALQFDNENPVYRQLYNEYRNYARQSSGQSTGPQQTVVVRHPFGWIGRVIIFLLFFRFIRSIFYLLFSGFGRY